MGARYAVWGALDSSNDIRILAENDHYRGAFTVFACFAIIWLVRRWGSAGIPVPPMAARWLNLESKSGIVGR
jgi:hypothetical protein